MKRFIPLALFAIFLMGAAPERRASGQSRGSSGGGGGSRSSAGSSSGGQSSGGARSSGEGRGSSSAGQPGRSSGGSGRSEGGVSAPRSSGGRESGGRIPGGIGSSRIPSGSAPDIVRIPGGDQPRLGGDIVRIPSPGRSEPGPIESPATPRGGERREEPARPVTTPYDEGQRPRVRVVDPEPYPRFISERPRGSLDDPKSREAVRSGESRSRVSPGRLGTGRDTLDTRYRDRITRGSADAPRGSEAREGRGVAAPTVSPRGRIDYASPPGRRTLAPTRARSSVVSAPTRRIVAKRTLDAARRETSAAFTRSPRTVVHSSWNSNCWNTGVNWWSGCHSGFSCSPGFWWSPWCHASFGWSSWWNWSWCHSRWSWSWGSWCDPFWAASWYWPWYASVSYVPASTVVYVEREPDQTIYAEPSEPAAPVEQAPPAAEPAEPAGPGYPGKGGESITEKYVRLADLYFRAGRYDRAVDNYLRATEFAPEQGSLWFMLSDALLGIGDYHFAAHAIRRAVEKDPTLVESRANKREFYAVPADFDAHLAQLEKFLKDHDNDGDAWFVLGYNFHFSGQTSEAKEAFLKAKDRLPSDKAVDLFLAAADVREAEESRPATKAAPGDVK